MGKASFQAANLLYAETKLGRPALSFDAALSVTRTSVSFCNAQPDVFALRDGTLIGLYSWLSEEEFELLQSEDGTYILEWWISGLDLDIESVPDNIGQCSSEPRHAKFASAVHSSWSLADAEIVS